MIAWSAQPVFLKTWLPGWGSCLQRLHVKLQNARLRIFGHLFKRLSELAPPGSILLMFDTFK